MRLAPKPPHACTAHRPERPLLSISLSYPVIFALGFGCSLSYYGYLRYSPQIPAVKYCENRATLPYYADEA